MRLDSTQKSLSPQWITLPRCCSFRWFATNVEHHVDARIAVPTGLVRTIAKLAMNTDISPYAKFVSGKKKRTPTSSTGALLTESRATSLAARMWSNPKRSCSHFEKAGSFLCSWWRRGRVELPVQGGYRFDFYERSRRWFSRRRSRPVGVARVATS